MKDVLTKVVHIRSCRYPNSLEAEAGPRATDCQSYSMFLNSSLAPPEVGEPCSQAEDPGQSESGQDPSHILLKKKSDLHLMEGFIYYHKSKIVISYNPPIYDSFH